MLIVNIRVVSIRNKKCHSPELSTKFKIFKCSLTEFTEFFEIPPLGMAFECDLSECFDQVLCGDCVAVATATVEMGGHHLDPTSNPELVRRLLLVTRERIRVVFPHVGQKSR